MKKLMLIAGIGFTVLAASAFEAKQTDIKRDMKAGLYEQSDTVPGKKKGDTARHRYPKDSTRPKPVQK